VAPLPPSVRTEQATLPAAHTPRRKEDESHRHLTDPVGPIRASFCSSTAWTHPQRARKSSQPSLQWPPCPRTIRGARSAASRTVLAQASRHPRERALSSPSRVPRSVNPPAERHLTTKLPSRTQALAWTSCPSSPPGVRLPIPSRSATSTCAPPPTSSRAPRRASRQTSPPSPC
jgi:hypothetical protein